MREIDLYPLLKFVLELNAAKPAKENYLSYLYTRVKIPQRRKSHRLQFISPVQYIRCYICNLRLLRCKNATLHLLHFFSFYLLLFFIILGGGATHQSESGLGGLVKRNVDISSELFISYANTPIKCVAENCNGYS